MKKLLLLIILVAIGTVVYNVLMYYDNNFPYGRMRETPAVRPYENPLPVMEAGLVPTHGGEALYRAASPETLKAPFSIDDPKVIKDGAQQYFNFCQYHRHYGRWRGDTDDFG